MLKTANQEGCNDYSEQISGEIAGADETESLIAEAEPAVHPGQKDGI